MTNTKWLTLALVAVFAVACDPYDDVPGGAPRVMGIVATSGSDVTVGEASSTTTDWTLDDVASTCDPHLRAAGAPAAGSPRVAQNSTFVTLNRQIDGGIIQTSLDDCTPKDAWLSGTPLVAGMTWYSCYSPSSPSPDEGGNIVIFLAPEESATVAPASGWADGYDDNGFSYTPAHGETVTTYTLAGARLTDVGVGTITLNVAPNPGDAYRYDPEDDSPFLDFLDVTQTAVTIAIDAACATPTTTYTVERAPNVVGRNGAADSPGTYAQLDTDLPGPTYQDTGLDANTKYWYRVTASTASGYDGPRARDFVTTDP